MPGLKNPYRVKLAGAAVTLPLAVTKPVTLLSAGDVTFNGSFTPNDFNATAYFRYRLTSATTWINTSPTAISGFNTAQNLIKTVSGLSIGVSYTVQAVIVNSSNVTLPVYGALVNFTPTL